MIRTRTIDFDGVGAHIREVAAEHILPFFGKLGPNQIAFKTGDDPVTIADKNAESALSDRLSRLLPGSKVLGEETFAADSAVLEHLSCESPVWIIDPIDGTRNFIAGKRQFGVIVALAERNQTIAGWIYDPTSNEVVTAERGSGAFYKGQRLKTATPPSFYDMHGFLGDRLVLAREKGDPSGAAPRFDVMTAGAHEYPRLVLDEPHFGGSYPQSHFRASKFHTTPWDDAAGVLIFEEAGGFAAHWDGSSYDSSAMHRGLVLASNRELWQELKDWCLRFIKLSA